MNVKPCGRPLKQPPGSCNGERGYAMAALLVSIAVLMVLMSVAMPVWRTQAKREKEAELIFRGEQYARAINLYTRKMGPGNFPPSIDVLVQQRFLRKKFKDPMTADGEFDLITAASAGQSGSQPPFGTQPQGLQGRGGIAPSSGLSAPPSIGAAGGGSRGGTPQPGGRPSGSPFSGSQGSPSGQFAPGGGIMGVRSKSKDPSFRVYNGGTHYNEWQFMFASVSGRPGGGQGGPAGAPGGVPGGAFGTSPGGRGGRGPGRRGGMAPPPPPPPPGGFGPGARPMGGRGPG